MNQPNDYPYTFNPSICRGCGGECCRGTGGYVWITQKKMERMATLKMMDLETFADLYVRAVQGKLALQERRVNGEFLCCFFDTRDAKCAIYPERPEQCRTYPFWDMYRDRPQQVLKACPGVTLKES